MADDKQLPESDRQAVVVSCNDPECDTDVIFAEKRAHSEMVVTILVGASVAITPPLLILVSYLAAVNNLKLPLNEQLMGFCIVAMGTVIAFVFGKGAVKKLLG